MVRCSGNFRVWRSLCSVPVSLNILYVWRTIAAEEFVRWDGCGELISLFLDLLHLGTAYMGEAVVHALPVSAAKIPVGSLEIGSQSSGLTAWSSTGLFTNTFTVVVALSFEISSTLKNSGPSVGFLRHFDLRLCFDDSIPEYDNFNNQDKGFIRQFIVYMTR